MCIHICILPLKLLAMNCLASIRVCFRFLFFFHSELMSLCQLSFYVCVCLFSSMRLFFPLLVLRWKSELGDVHQAISQAISYIYSHVWSQISPNEFFLRCHSPSLFLSLSLFTSLSISTSVLHCVAQAAFEHTHTHIHRTYSILHFLYPFYLLAWNIKNYEVSIAA